MVLKSFKEFSKKLTPSKIKKSLKGRIGIKGNIRDLINPIAIISAFQIKRNKVIKLNIKKFKYLASLIEDQISSEKAILLASAIWKEPLRKRLNMINELIFNKDFLHLKNLYEKLFVTDLMEGAVLHQEGISKISRISQCTRFFKRSKQVEKELAFLNINLVQRINSLLVSENYNYGQPLFCNLNKKCIEYPDELYFAISISKIIESNKYEEIVFIGDGAGFLIPLIIEINNFHHINNKCNYRIIDFLHFSIASFLRIGEIKNNVCIDLPENLHNFTGQSVLPGKLPKLNGKRLIINQDSFPEMGKASLITYLKNTADSTDIFSYNQSPNDLCQKHSDFILILKQFKYALISSQRSLIRENYFLNFYKSE